MTLGKIITDSRKERDRLERLFGEIGGPGSGIAWFKVEQDSFRINAASCIISTRGMGSSFTLAHPGFGWLGGVVAASVAAGSQPYLGDSRTAWTTQIESGDTMVYTNEGRDWIVDALAGNAPTAPGYLAFGSDDTTSASGDTANGSQWNRATVAFESMTSGTRYIEFEGIVLSTEPSGIQPVNFEEVGIFTGSPTSTGSILARSTFADLEKSQDVELQCLYRIEVD